MGVLSALRSAPARFLDALAFFTCLIPARMFSGSRLSACMPWFVPSGLFVGAVTTTAAVAAHALLTLSGHGSVAAALGAGFIWVACEVLVSRALHWDGLADLADATGSGKEGEAFWGVMKDSRVGALGAMALIVVFAGQCVGATLQADAGHWTLLILAPAWARGMAALTLCLAAPRDAGSLGGKMAQGATPATTWLTAALLAVILLVAPTLGATRPGAALLVALTAGMMLLIRRVARRQGGINGDFAGAVIEISQLLFLVACA